MTLNERRVRVESLSRSRLERFQTLLTSLPGGLELQPPTVHPIDPMDRASGANRARSTRAGVGEGAAREASNSVRLRLLREWMENWPNTPLPALDGRTPREARADVALRPRLVDLMKAMEWGAGPGAFVGGPEIRAIATHLEIGELSDASDPAGPSGPIQAGRRKPGKAAPGGRRVPRHGYRRW